MKFLEPFGLKILHRFDPEVAHGLSLRALNLGLGPQHGVVKRPRLDQEIAGLRFRNPVGLAAGYDKNAIALKPLSKAGFGFLEVGAATPRPQEGNPKPRLYRLSDDRAVINRFGFNNEGMEPIGQRLANVNFPVPVGLNLGADRKSVV